MSSASKMKLRAEILSVLSKYNTEDGISLKTGGTLRKDLQFFEKFEEKDFLAKILIDEIISGKDVYVQVCSLFIINVLDKKHIEDYAIKVLKNKDIPSQKKIYLLSLLKQKDISFENHEMEEFIGDLAQTAADSIKNFLSGAMNNPEIQIDLLDFYSNIACEEKTALLTNIAENSPIEEAVNAFSVLSCLELSSKEKLLISDILLSTNSPYALKGLNNILNSDETEDLLKHRIRKKIKEINFKNPDFKYTAFIKDSKPYVSYITFADGNDEFSLIFARIDKKRLIDAFFTTISIKTGIISCIGFYKIHKKNFEEILFRLFDDAPPVKIQPDILVSFLDYYLNKNTETNSLVPYEFNIWINLTNDIEKNKENLPEHINSKLEYMQIQENKLSKIFNSKTTDSWFYIKGEDKKADKIFSVLTEENISDIEKLENDISEFTDKVFSGDKDFVDIFKTRLLIQAYVAKIAKLNVLSGYLFTMRSFENYVKAFLNHIFKRSIYCCLRTQIRMKKRKTNVFERRKKLNFTVEQMSDMTELMEKKWHLKREY